MQVNAPPAMNEVSLRQVLQQLSDGSISIDEAWSTLAPRGSGPTVEDLGFARVDHDRLARQGFPEVVYGAGKTSAQVAEIARAIVGRGHTLLVTRTTREAYEAVRTVVPDAAFHETARAISCVRTPSPRGHGTIAIVAAGTSDLPVAEEAALTAEVMGNDIERVYDVGVAGLHRLLQARDTWSRANVLIVVAGMEGALPSVVGGLVSAPVIAVPTSAGYGASFGGLAALLGMLNSCAAGVAVVNIDNGFGAGTMASRINHRPLTTGQ